MPMIRVGDTWGCSNCGSANCGEFTCWETTSEAEEQNQRRIERKLELRREASNRRGRFATRYTVVVDWLEGNCREGVWYGNTLYIQGTFYTWRMARKRADRLDCGEPEMRIRIFDQEFLDSGHPVDVTHSPAPACVWPGPRLPDPFDFDNIPF
jgi:hypothetical protein